MECTLYVDGFVGSLPWPNGETQQAAAGSAVLYDLFGKSEPARNAFWYGTKHTVIETEFLALIDGLTWIKDTVEAPGLHLKGVSIEVRLCAKEVIRGIVEDIEFSDSYIEELRQKAISLLQEFAEYEIIFIGCRDMARILGETKEVICE